MIHGDFGSGTEKVTINGDFEVTGTLIGGGAFTLDAQENLFAGTSAGAALLSGANDNFLAGNLAGTAITTGDSNIAIGLNALDAVQTGSFNIALGQSALGTATGSGQLAIGYFAGSLIGTGVGNIMIGQQAGRYADTTSSNNTFVGYDAGLGVNTQTTCSGNTALGRLALTAITTGGDNIAVGYNAGNGVTTGSNNILIGDGAGDKVTTSSNTICIGTAAGPTTTQANQLFIDIVESNTPLIHGDFSTDVVTINGDFQVTQHIYFDAEVANTTATAINWTNGNKQSIAPTAATSPTYTFTAPDGPTNLTLKATNLGAVTAVTWPATVKWPGGTEPTWTSSGTDIISFYYDGTNYYGSAGLAFA